jgi:hypothetical protein
MNIEFIPIAIQTKILILVTLKQETKINERKFPINFEIYLNSPLNKKEPIVLCKTHFIFPTLFDNKNLFKCLCSNWDNLDSISYRIKMLILNIPNFVNTYENIIKENKLLCFIGEYNFNYDYKINDFILNKENYLFRVKTDDNFNYNKNVTKNDKYFLEQFLENFKNIYIILTDFYLLFIEPSKREKLKHKGKIFLIGKIIDINKLIITFEEKDNIRFKLEIKENSNFKFDNNLIMNKDNFDLFNELIKERKKKLEKNFLFFLPCDNISKLYFAKKDFLNLREIISEIKHEYKHNNINNIYSEKIIISLLNFMAEILKSFGEKKGYALYLNKLNRFLNKINYD